MDEIACFNRDRWDELSLRGIPYGRPWLDLTRDLAMGRIDPENVLRGKPVAGMSVLCLAGGGGQQSVAFALLGARVTVLDLSDVQLSKDRSTADHYGLEVRTVQGDMRDLRALADASFEIVWHAHSLNFVPDPLPVFSEVSRVIRPGGLYRLSYSNPFYHGMNREQSEAGCYRLCLPYREGEISLDDPDWTFVDTQGRNHSIRGPREFRHTLGSVINRLAAARMQLIGLWEDTGQRQEPGPGNWAHSQRIAPQFLTMWYTRAGDR